MRTFQNTYPLIELIGKFTKLKTKATNPNYSINAWCNEPTHRQIIDKPDCPRCMTCGKKVML